MNIKNNIVRKPFETVLSFDPAIDIEKSNQKEFLRTRDMSHLQFKSGMTPTKFVLRDVPRSIFINFMLKQTLEAQFISAFQYGIVRIENLKSCFLSDGYEVEGNGLTIWEPTEVVTIGDTKLKYLSDEDAQNLFDIPTMLEIGSVILKKTQSTRAIKQDYPVLPTSIEAIEKMK